MEGRDQRSRRPGPLAAPRASPAPRRPGWRTARNAPAATVPSARRFPAPTARTAAPRSPHARARRRNRAATACCAAATAVAAAVRRRPAAASHPTRTTSAGPETAAGGATGRASAVVASGGGAPRGRPPGTGRMICVLSESSGSANGLSLGMVQLPPLPRMAQSSIFSSGNSPDTWMAKPPEDCICCQCGLLRSSSK